MSWWQWFALSLILPLPPWLVWRWRLHRAKRKAYLESKEYRRAKFGGAIKVPGSAVAERIDRRP